MKTTRYFEEQVLRKRPYIKREWCRQALLRPLFQETQPDGRIRRWIFVDESIFSSKDEPEDGGWGFLSSWGSFLVFWF